MPECPSSSTSPGTRRASAATASRPRSTRSRPSRCATAPRDWAVYRYKDDLYKFQQIATFEDSLQYTLYWNGPEFQAFRADYSGWYQVPVLYYPMTLTGSGTRGLTESQLQ